MALQRAKITQTIEEKRYYTLNFLEAAVVAGTEVIITPVDKYEITTLSGELFTYLNPINTYVILDQRPSVHLLQKYGWFKEDQTIVPIIAYIPTHLLFRHTDDEGNRIGYYEYDDFGEGTWVDTPEINNYVALSGKEFQQLVKEGVSDYRQLMALPIKRGTIISIKYDFIPDTITASQFVVSDVKVDTVSLNYIANLVPYKHDIEEDQKEPATVEDDGTKTYTKFNPSDY